MSNVVNALAQGAMPQPEEPRGVVAALADFFSPEAGQRRRRALNETLSGAADYYLGPTGIPDRLNALAFLNPVHDMEQATLNAQAMIAPGATGRERFDAGVGMVTDMATVLAPAYGASRVGMDGAAALVDSLTGIGGTMREGVQDAGRRFLADEAGSVRFGPDTDAQAVARMLREGRAAEVTDDMMARVDPQEMHRLYTSGATGQPMPMDEASRMARAREMGFDTDAYHVTRTSEGFDRFKPGWRGSTYFAATPQDAALGAIGGAQDFSLTVGRGPTATIPVMIPGDEVARLRPSRAQWDKLPDQAFLHNERDLAKSVVGARYSDDVFDTTFSEGGNISIRKRPYPDQKYSRDSKTWTGEMLPGWNSGSDIASLDRVAAQSGQKGFLVSDEAGASIVAGPSMPIRSRFARFDPRLSHLANLSAVMGGLAILPRDEE